MSISNFYEIVTLDGPSGAGKSTVAKLTANILGYKYLDTGAMYRAVTLYILRNNIDIKDVSKLKSALKEIDIKFDIDGKVYLNCDDVTKDIRGKCVVDMVSEVSAIGLVRENMVSLQRGIACGGKYVVDGRDIGSVVFPMAKYKFYIDASLDERARRRYEEEIKKCNGITFEEVKNSIIRRDEYDATRKDSPLVVPNDALVIDTTNMFTDEVVKKITDVVLKINSSNKI